MGFNRIRSLSRLSWTKWLGGWILFLSLVAADDSITYPSQYGYTCNTEQKTCLYTGSTDAKYTDAISCMEECNPSETSDGTTLITTSGMNNGTCTNCSMNLFAHIDLNRLFTTFKLNSETINSSNCKLSAQVEIEIPSLWKYEQNTSTCTIVHHTSLPCMNQENKTTMTLDKNALLRMLEPQSSQYQFNLNHISTRQSPGNFSDPSVWGLELTSTGCMENGDTNGHQAFKVQLFADSYELKGSFTKTSMSATDPRVMAMTSITMTFINGAVMSPGSFFLLRVAKDVEPIFGMSIRQVNTAHLIVGFSTFPLDVELGPANISFVLPDTFPRSLQNGEWISIQFDNFKNPMNISSGIEKAYLSAFQSLTITVENSIIPFYKLRYMDRTLKAAGLDIASIGVFGICFLVSLIIIRWHGLPLTMTTLWTDMVAISSMLSFATGTGGYLVWAIQPSKAWVYWYSGQYFFNAVMVLSLCFHWATVLSFKAFKKLTMKSPVVIGYGIANLSILIFIIICCIKADTKLKCVFEQTVPKCGSEIECDQTVAAGGRTVRDAVRICDMQRFFLAWGVGLVFYTVILMVLGCMVMRRGRLLMLNEDPSDSRIRQSLTIFYMIIASTIVLYISAQVIYIAQYLTVGVNSSELSDIVWYIFIVWLPQGIPPLLLLFLQWNPSTETYHTTEVAEESIDQSSKEDVFNMTPRSSGSSPTLHYSKLFRSSLAESVLNDEPGNKLRLIVRLRLPVTFDRACFVSLDFCSIQESFSHDVSIRDVCRHSVWKCVGTTEPVGVKGDTEAVVTNGVASALFPFVAVLEVPVNGPASHTLLRFLVHASTIGTHETSSETSQLSYQMTMFIPLLEFITTSQAVLDAAASGQPLNVFPSDDHTCTILEDSSKEIESIGNAELSIQTVMMPGEDPSKEDLAHKHIGNIIRFFQYDSEDGHGGLVVEDLQESIYTNVIPRQLIELIAIERQQQVDQAREELHTFVHKKKEKQNRGFYGTLIGQIQEDTDFTRVKEWLEGRYKRRKEYVAMLRKNIQYLVNRDKHKHYFKASVEKKVEDLRFIPINLHIQDLLIGPTKAFMNEEQRRASKEVSVYDFTTVGAPAAHCYKFNKGGILSYQAKLKKMETKLTEMESLDRSKWPEEVRECDDLQWDLQLRMDCCFAQAITSLTTSFVRKIEVAIQNPDSLKGEDMLCQLSTLGFLFQVESLLSTHGKEIGMIEDMAGAVAQLSCVAFVLQDVRDKPTNRFSFRMSRKKEMYEEAAVMKVSVSQKPAREVRNAHVKYIITVQVVTGSVELPERLAAGGEISVTPVLFTHGINEMQTIANNTERAKTELQDMININNLRPLKQYCEKYCRLTVALPSLNLRSTTPNRYYHGSNRGYKSMNQAPMRLTEEQVTEEFHALENAIMDAAQSLVKTKRPEILQRSSDLCRELGGGRVTVCKSAKDRTAMSVTLEQVRILQRHHDLPPHRIPATVSVMRSHGVRIENALKNTGKRQFAFNKLQRSLLPEDYRCPDQLGGANVS